MGLFRFFYTSTINRVTTGARKKPIGVIVCFIYSQQCIKSFRRAKFVAFQSVFKKSIPNSTTL